MSQRHYLVEEVEEIAAARGLLVWREAPDLPSVMWSQPENSDGFFDMAVAVGAKILYLDVASDNNGQNIARYVGFAAEGVLHIFDAEDGIPDLEPSDAELLSGIDEVAWQVVATTSVGDLSPFPTYENSPAKI